MRDILFYFFFTSARASGPDRTSKAGSELSRAARTRAESHLKRILKRTRARIASPAAIQIGAVRPACIAVCVFVRSLLQRPRTVPDTNRYVAGLPSFQGRLIRSPIAVYERSPAERARARSRFFARNASSHPAESGKRIHLLRADERRVMNKRGGLGRYGSSGY